MNIFKIQKDKYIINLLESTKDKVILDIGGGTGRLAKKLSKQCKKVYVVDESKAMLSKINKTNKIIPVQCNALNMDFEDKHFDIVLLTDTIHHIKHKKKIINKIKQVLKDNGILLIHDFDLNKFFSKVIKVFEKIIFKNVYFVSKTEIQNILKNNGFKLKKELAKNYWYISIWEIE